MGVTLEGLRSTDFRWSPSRHTKTRRLLGLSGSRKLVLLQGIGLVTALFLPRVQEIGMVSSQLVPVSCL